MNDREKFLTQIAEEPADDVRRLVYADWLEEFGDRGDLDVATAEFIRLACSRSGSDTMPQAAFRWLSDHEYRPGVENWKRLVPRLLDLHQPRLAIHGVPSACRDGRRINVELHLVLLVMLAPELRKSTVEIIRRPTPVNLWFRRGFLEGCKVYHRLAREKVRPAVEADQPLCRFLAPEQEYMPATA